MGREIHADGMGCDCDDCNPIHARMEKMMDAAEIKDGEALMMVNETGIRLIIPQATDPGGMENLILNEYQKMAISFAEMCQDKLFRKLITEVYDAKQADKLEQRGSTH